MTDSNPYPPRELCNIFDRFDLLEILQDVQGSMFTATLLVTRYPIPATDEDHNVNERPNGRVHAKVFYRAE